MAKTYIFELDMRGAKIDALRRDLIGPVLGRSLFTASEAVLIPAIRARIKANKSVDTGNLFRNLQTKVEVQPVSMGAAISVGSIGVEYGLDVELGRGPHKPDFQRLMGWVRRKLRPPNVTYTTVRIFNKIQKKGIKPRPYLLVSFEKVQSRFVNDFFLRYKASLGV